MTAQGGAMTTVPLSFTADMTGVEVKIAAVGQDRFVVVVDDRGDGNPPYTPPHFRLFDSNGQAVSGDIALPAAGGYARYFDVADLKDGGFLVTWFNDTDQRHYYTRYDLNGAAMPGQSAQLLSGINGIIRVEAAGDGSGGFLYAARKGNSVYDGMALTYVSSTGVQTSAGTVLQATGLEGDMVFDGTDFWFFYTTHITDEVYAIKASSAGVTGSPVRIGNFLSKFSPKAEVLANGNFLLTDANDMGGTVSRAVIVNKSGTILAETTAKAGTYSTATGAPDGGVLWVENFPANGGSYDTTITPWGTTFFEPLNTPPVLAAPAALSYTDTAAPDTLPTRTGSLSATDDKAVLAYGITGGQAGNQVVNGITYNLSKAGAYGTLYLRSSDGAYAYVPNNGAIDALAANRTESFTVTATDAEGSSGSATLTVTVNGVNDRPILVNLHGYEGQFVPGSADPVTDLAYITPDNVSVSDPDSADFAGGYLLITQNSGNTDGRFVTDMSIVMAGTDQASADGILSAGEKLYVDLAAWGGAGLPGMAEVGTISIPTPGSLRIDFHPNANVSYLSYLLQNLTYTAPSAGTRVFSLTLGDGDGGVSTPVSFSMTGADTDPPVLQALTPHDNATAVATDVSPQLSFNEAIKFGTGKIQLIHVGTGTVVEAFDVASAQGTGNGQVSIAGNTLTLNPSATLAYSTAYAIRIDQGAVTDLSNNAFAGIADNTSFDFTTISAPPTLTISATPGALKAGQGVTITFTFSQKPHGFDALDVQASGGSLGSLSADPLDDKVYTALFTPDAAQSLTVSLSVAAGKFTNADQQANLASNTLTLSGDTQSPLLTAIERATPLASQTNADTLRFKLSFSEAVALAAADLRVHGSTASVTRVDAIDGSSYYVTVAGGDLAGLDGATVSLGFAPAQDIRDSGGNALLDTSPTGANQSFVMDNSVAMPSLTLASDTGASATDGVTAAGTINVTLAAEMASWEYSSNGGADWHAGSGTSFVLAQGAYAAGSVLVRQTDHAGNLSAAAQNGAAITVDLQVPAPTLALAADTGASASDGVTRNATVNVSLAADAASWEYSTDGGTSWNAGSGSSFTLGANTYAAGTIRARQTDVAGNLSAAATNVAAITVDTAVAAPALTLPADTGSSTSDGITRDATVQLTLALDAASWEYSTDGGASWNAGSGTSFKLAAASYAAGAIQVRQSDIAGNLSAAAANAAAITVDTAVAAPVLTLPADTGTSGSDGITRDTTVQLTLALDAAGWEYSTDGGASWNAGSGTSFTLAAGSYLAGSIQVRQTDIAGNLSPAATNATAITVDTAVAAPVLILPADTGTGSSDGITRDTTVQLTLALDAASWEYSTDGGASWSAGSGTSFTLAAGSYPAGAIQVRQTDIAGNLSASTASGTALTVDTSVGMPAFALALDTGASASDGITNAATVDVSLALDAASWEYSLDGGASWNAGSGTSFTLAASTYAAGSVQVRQTDIAGNLGAAAANAAPITVDTAVSAPGFALALDTGASASDGVTRNATVAVSLALDAAGWEYSTDGGASWNAGSGTSFTLAASTYAAGSVQVRQTDIAGNLGAAAANAAPITVDTAVSAPGFALALDTGASASDGVTRNATVAVSLALDAAGWEYSTDGGASWNVGSGTSFTLAASTYAAGAIQVRQTDIAGNLSAAATNAAPVTVDTNVAAPGSVLAVDTGASATDGITREATFDVSLALDAASWEDSLDGGASWSAGSGTSFTLAAGSYAAGAIQVRQTDIAGNLSASTASGTALTVDTSVGMPAFALALDTGASASDGITNAATVDVSLALDAASWEYSLDGGTSWNAGSGTSFTLAASTYAAGAVQVRQTDIAGNLGAAAANAAPITVDTAVSAPGFALALDTGASASDGVTRNATVDVSLAPDAAGWEYSLDGGASWSAGSGTSFTLADGLYAAGALRLRQTDQAGNLSAAGTNAAPLRIDTVAPTAGPVLRPTLNQPGGNDSFTIGLALADASAGIDAASLGAGDLVVTGPGTVGTLAVLGASFDSQTGIATYTIAAPAAGWSASQHAGSWTIGLAGGQVVDLAGNAMAANANLGAFNVVFNAAPVITNRGGGTSAEIAMAERQAVVATVTASDPDGDALSYSIIGGADSALFDIDGSTGVLRLRTAPVFGQPADAGRDNVYEVDVKVSDGKGGIDTQALRISVLADLDGDGTADRDDSDLDNDGRPNSIEDAVPGAFGTAGDGNGDGIADSAQINVASLPTVVGGAPYATLAVDPGLTLSAVSSAPAPGGLPRNVKLPLGVFDFTIGNVVLGAAVEISIYVDAALKVNSYFKQDISGKWTNLAKSVTTVGSKTRITFELVDGGIFDSDGLVNGSITDPGGVAVMAPVITSDGGLATAHASVQENTTAVTTVRAEAFGSVTYSISGGADAALFTIDALSGALRFAAAPDFEIPGGQARDNSYLVEVTATDASGSASQMLTVAVTDVDERPPVVHDTVDGVEIRIGTVDQPDGSSARLLDIPIVIDTRHEQVGNNTVADIPLASRGGQPVLSAQLPVGYGLQVIGDGAPKAAGASLTDLIREITLHTETGSRDQLNMVGGGSDFLSGIASDAPLLVQTLRPASSAQAGATPLVIAGTPHAPDAPLAALVIDTRALSAGTAIALQDVAFAAIVGAATVTGNGAQAVWGDGASQSIMLGTGNGILHGGGGDDILGSTGGNSRIFGDEGNDLLFGGTGTNYLDGGSGQDTVRLAGASLADYSMRIAQGNLVLSHRAQASAGADTIANVETLRFAAAGMEAADVSFNGSDVAMLVRLYSTMFGRQVDEDGINFWLGCAEAGLGMREIADNFLQSTEAQQRLGQASNAAFVAHLYQVGLGRSASVAELAYWTEVLDRGMGTRAEVLVGFAESAEKIGLVGTISTTIDTF
nr:choice-of-anchor U domain-containing protein [Massilia sp. MS-15]